MRTTVDLLWMGRELFVATEGDVQHVALPAGDATAAVVSAIRELAPSARKVRLGYHTGEMRVQAVECARGDRAVLCATLGEDHPGLLNPQTSWAASPIHSDVTGSSTLLWIDPTNVLSRLRQALENERKQLEGVWPLPDLMAAAACPQAGQSAIVVLITESMAIVFSTNKSGGRSALWTRQAEVHEELGRLLRTTVTRFDPGDPPEVTLIDAGAEPRETSQSAIADFSTRQLDVRELFAALAKVTRTSVSNFCPPRRPQFGVIGLFAAAAVVGVIGVVNGALYVRDVVRMNSDSEARAAAIRELRASNAHLAQNRESVQALRAFEVELGCDEAGRLRLVEVVASAKPREITIHTIRIAESRFEIGGTAHEGVGQSSGPFYVFLDRLANSGAKLQFDAELRPAALTSAEFALKGRWR